MSVFDPHINQGGPIREVWNGREYKSRFEARGARFVHAWASDGREKANPAGQYKRARVEYEPQSYTLADGSSYAPDFRVLTRGERLGTVESCGEAPVFIECRGYETPANGLQIQLFAEYCRQTNADFLVLYWDRLEFFNGSGFAPNDPFTNEVFIGICSMCRTPIVTAILWVLCETNDELALYVLGKIVDGKMFGAFATRCHHCGNIGQAIERLQRLQMKDGKLLTFPQLQLMTPVPGMTGGEWATWELAFLGRDV
jgi:hypothetical protein